MAVITYTYPVSRELMAILPDKIARVSEGRVGLQIMPVRGINAAMLEWTQRDNSSGLQQIRGYEGQPTRIKTLGSKRLRVEPGVYGEYFAMLEQELTTKAGSVEGDVVVNIETEILEYQDRLTEREVDRIEQIIWLLLTTGTFAVPQARGDGTTVIVYTDTFPIQTLTVAVQWQNSATATPLKNLRTLPILTRGKGLSFRRKATAYMNQKTFNDLVSNTNGADLGGQRQGEASPLLDADDVNKVFIKSDVPTVVIYDEGYYDDDNNFVLYIPDNKVVIVGARNTGEKIGEYLKTRNLYAGNRPLSYSFVKDFTKGATDGGVANDVQIGKGVEIHQGHNGGPVLYFPGAIFVLNV